MELTALILAGFADAVLESLLPEDIQRLIAPLPERASSFTTLLELPPTRTLELLRSPEAPNSLGVAIFGDPVRPYLHFLGGGGGRGGGNGKVEAWDSSELMGRKKKKSRDGGERKSVEGREDGLGERKSV